MFDFDHALITGGAGFIGSHLGDRLVDDCAVTVYDDLSTGSRENIPDDAAFIHADVRDDEPLRDAVRAADVVFHEAAQVSVQRSVDNPETSHAVNIDPLLTILEAARDTDTRVVFASSAAIYGHLRSLPIDESHPKTPTSPYGLEKLTADHYCRLYHERYGVDAVALRYFNAYGPRQQGGVYSGVIGIFRDQARAGNDLTVEGDGTQTRDFVHIDDIVEANLLAAATEEAAGEAFNIGTGDSITIRELAETIRDVTDSDAEIVHVDSRPGDIDHSKANISKARDVLGFEPTYDVAAGLDAYLG
ncbi:NAD-dependent epimerase/dehydratase family protein [Halorubrum ezzemoulense]|uniref:NAD-dependent epimerase/dehydratase family protein n=1 Tax=Halorubrum ezzemoulense TaxID=337243 RepID=UPI00232EA858|nr:NAD-dependent epimerase/dehydratase family protein [Halorubrum ezzemoulense]MDB2248614.1 GDP-mannose 4,6-dehydratase [Halorubrum ezzemoulense]